MVMSVLMSETLKGKGVLFFALLVLLLGGGCADFRTVERQQLPAEQIALIAEHAALYREVTDASPFIESLDGYADVWIKTPAQQHRVFCNIRINRDHETRMIVTAGLLGWPVADIFFSKDSLYVHDLLNNRLFQGSNNSRNLEKILGVNSGYELMRDSLLGLVRVTEPLSALTSVKQGAGQLSFTFNTSTGSKEVIIDPSRRTLTALLLKNQEGVTTTEVHFRSFETLSIGARSVLLPKEVDMVLNSSGAVSSGEHQLVIVYDERKFNQGNPVLKFSMPKNAKVFNLDESGIFPWM